MQSLQDVSSLANVKGTSMVVMVNTRLVLQAKHHLPLAVPTPNLYQQIHVLPIPFSFIHTYNGLTVLPMTYI